MKSIRQCLNKQLAEICRRSVQLEELTQKINSLLPAELAPYCKVSSFNKGCLVLVASDASWASQLRYAVPELRDQLRAGGMYQLSSIKISIADAPEFKKNAETTHYELTHQAKENILNESQNCSYEPLRQALRHLVHGDER